LAILTAGQMTANETSRSPAGLRQGKRKTRSLQAAHYFVQFCAMPLAALMSLASGSPTRAQSSPSVEYQVKAAFLLNFAKFIEWPRNAFQDEKTPITVCIFRYDPFDGALDEIIRGKSINNRELLARRVGEIPELKSCQLIFVSEREEKRLPEIMNSLKGASALVVGEGGDFAERGGSVQFFLENNRMRFAINVDAIERARLTVSSKLLLLARIVHDQGHPRGD
jgi:hypothetical protein